MKHMPDSSAEKLQRVRLMADEEQQTWDLSDNDMAALRHVLDVNAQMLDALKHLTGLIADLRNVYSNDASEFIMNKPSYKAAAEAIKLAEGDQ